MKSEDNKRLHVISLIENESTPFSDEDFPILMQLGYYKLIAIDSDYKLLDELIHPVDDMF